MSATAPEAPPFSDTTTGCFIRLFFWMAACIMRAIWSEAPPAPAATTISTGLVGSQAAIAALLKQAANAAANTAVLMVLLLSCIQAARRVGFAAHSARYSIAV